jgi:hypothetical protein
MEKEQLRGEQIFVIHHFLSQKECENYIAMSEQSGYEDAPVTSSVGFVTRKDIRNNARVIRDDPELVGVWWDRAKPLLPAEWFGWEIAGVNERFRFYRYDPGQRFVRHTDGFFERESGERSQLTFMVYLNHGFEGGATRFHVSKPPLSVLPERGTALVFMHRLLHEGTPVVKGRKYVLRTDVMYRQRDDEGCRTGCA